VQRLLLRRAEPHDRGAHPVDAHVLRAPGLVVGPHLLAHHRLLPHGAAAAPVLRGPGLREQTLGRQELAESLGDGKILGIVGEGTQESLGQVLLDQLAQPQPQALSLLTKVVVHAPPPSGAIRRQLLDPPLVDRQSS